MRWWWSSGARYKTEDVILEERQDGEERLSASDGDDYDYDDQYRDDYYNDDLADDDQWWQVW